MRTCVCLFGSLGIGTAIYAGDLPENVVLVINASSESSKRIAQTYAILRDVPDSNLIWLSDVPDQDPISVDDFRERILKPLFAEIERRGLTNQIDIIAYSSDFPTAIDISKDLEKLPEIPKVVTKLGSINGLTTLYQGVLAENPAYVAADANWYVQLETKEAIRRPLQGSFAEAWGKADQAAQASQHQVAFDGFTSLSSSLGGYLPAELRAAMAAASLPDDKQSIDALQRAIKLGFRDGAWLRNEPAFTRLKENPDFVAITEELPNRSSADRPTQAFRAASYWTPSGFPTSNDKAGRRYFMSVMLAVTRGRGTKLDEALAQLTRSATADATMPNGIFLFTRTGDVRTQTRAPGYTAAVEALMSEGSRAEILEAALPNSIKDVAGLTMGSANFDWPASGSQLLPGAIAENLTSLGGVMKENGGQTPLTVFLQAGAGGSSGTVTEPYAIQAKFPEPFIHVHYRRGVNLAEAFHQSVAAPYQLLIVGDPLCAPWQSPPAINVEAASRVPTADNLVLTLKGDQLENHAIEVYLDGQLRARAPAQSRIDMSLAKLAPGHHRIAVAIMGRDEAQVPKRFVFEVPRLTQELSPVELRIDETQPTIVVATAPGADSIELRAFGLAVSRKEGGEARFDMIRDLPADRPLRLTAVAKIGDQFVISKPITLP